MMPSPPPRVQASPAVTALGYRAGVLRGLVLTALVTGAACRPPVVSPRALVTGRCLDLPGAYRTALVLAPEGDAAYWEEQGWERDALNLLRETQRIVKLDLATGELATVLSGIGLPFRVLPGGTVIAQRADRSSFTVVEPGKEPWDLVLADGKGRVTNLLADASGDRIAIGHAGGAIELFRLADRHRTRLRANGWLLYLDGDYVGYAHDDDWRISEMAPGLASPRALGTLPGEAWFSTGRSVFYIAGKVIGIWRRGHDVETLTEEPATIWGYTPQVLVSTNASPNEGTLFDRDQRWQLPTLSGGGRYTGAVRLADGRFLTLVAHDTRFDDEITDRDERDVCVVGAAGAVSVPSRTVPRAYEAYTKDVIAAATALGKADAYAFDRQAERATTLGFHLDGTGGTPAAMLERITQVEQALAGVLPPEITFAIYWNEDRAYARSWWSYRQERRRADAGNRTARVERAGDASLELDDATIADAPGELRCSGRLKNVTTAQLTLKVSCGDSWFQVVPAPLAAGGTGVWSVRVTPGADADVVALRARSHNFETMNDDVLIWFDADANRRATTELARAEAVRTQTGLVPVAWGRDSATSPIDVTLYAAAAFADLPEPERVARATAAEAALTPWIAAAADAPAGTKVAITIERGDIRWRLVDGRLEIVDD
jgi:hypothetical protein